jgi:hypothetical protein
MNIARLIVNASADTISVDSIHNADSGHFIPYVRKAISLAGVTPAYTCDENNDVIDIAKRAR